MMNDDKKIESEAELSPNVEDAATAAAELLENAQKGPANERRRFFRMASILPLKIWTQDNHGNRSDEEDTLSYDISATGISFICNHEIPTTCFVNVEVVELPFLDGFTVQASVVRCAPHTTKTGHTGYLIACDFRDQLTRAERTKLLRSVTVLQRVHNNKTMPAF